MADGGAPTLLAVAHGTRHPAGPETVRALLDRVRVLRPWLRVVESYGELAEPVLETALRGVDGPVVAVPLLLGRGYHALVDFPGRVERWCPDSVTARPLGPHALLAAAMADRLQGRPADAVVLGAAGSSDPAGQADVQAAARLLSRRLRRPVPWGLVAADGPALADVVAEQRRRGARRVAVASYVLAPGMFHDRMKACGADAVADPIGAHGALARLVLRRFDEARLGAAAALPVV
ncbi:sirohydrochlorin chelatase [Spirillospora sp. NPDC050679]